MTTEVVTERDVVLKVDDLRTYFTTRWGTVKAVDGISFDLRRGETLGIVGESGSGKSVTMLSLMQLIPMPPGRIVSGSIVLDGEDLLTKVRERNEQDPGQQNCSHHPGPDDFRSTRYSPLAIRCPKPSGFTRTSPSGR